MRERKRRERLRYMTHITINIARQRMRRKIGGLTGKEPVAKVGACVFLIMNCPISSRYI